MSGTPTPPLPPLPPMGRPPLGGMADMRAFRRRRLLIVLVLLLLVAGAPAAGGPPAPGREGRHAPLPPRGVAEGAGPAAAGGGGRAGGGAGERQLAREGRRPPRPAVRRHRLRREQLAGLWHEQRAGVPLPRRQL